MTATRAGPRCDSFCSSLFAAAATLPAQAPSFVATPLTEMGQSETYLGFDRAGCIRTAERPAGRCTPRPGSRAPRRFSRSTPTATRARTDGSCSSRSVCRIRRRSSAPTNGLQPCNPWTFIGQALVGQRREPHDARAGQRRAQRPDGDQVVDLATADNFDRVRDVDLAAQGLTEAQVQAVWLKEADARPDGSLPDADADAYTLETLLGDVIRSARRATPTCSASSSRAAATPATPSRTLNPEPYAYESGFAVKWIVQAQIDQMANGGMIVDPRAGDLTTTPASRRGSAGVRTSGPTARSPRGSDGLIWLPEDFQPDDLTHPSTSGETKVGTMLRDFFRTIRAHATGSLRLRDKTLSPTSGLAAGAAITVMADDFSAGMRF